MAKRMGAKPIELESSHVSMISQWPQRRSSSERVQARKLEQGGDQKWMAAGPLRNRTRECILSAGICPSRHALLAAQGLA